MNVDDVARKSADDLGRYELQEARERDHVDGVTFDQCSQLVAEWSVVRYDRRGANVRSTRARQGARARTVGRNEHNCAGTAFA